MPLDFGRISARYPDIWSPPDPSQLSPAQDPQRLGSGPSTSPLRTMEIIVIVLSVVLVVGIITIVFFCRHYRVTKRENVAMKASGAGGPFQDVELRNSPGDRAGGSSSGNSHASPAVAAANVDRSDMDIRVGPTDDADACERGWALWQHSAKPQPGESPCCQTELFSNTLPKHGTLQASLLMATGNTAAHPAAQGNYGFTTL